MLAIPEGNEQLPKTNTRPEEYKSAAEGLLAMALLLAPGVKEQAAVQEVFDDLVREFHSDYRYVSINLLETLEVGLIDNFWPQ
jgi:hypothetical protein